MDNGIRFGMAAIKNVGEGAVEAIIDVRNETGPFRSFFDLFRRVDLRKLNKRMMEGLIKAGAFDSMGGRRSQYLAVLDQAMDEGTSIQKERALGQTSIFGDDIRRRDTNTRRNPSLPDVSEWSQGEMLEIRTRADGILYQRAPVGAL